MFKFIVDSDIHFDLRENGNIEPWSYKLAAHKRMFEKMATDKTIEMVILAGDLCEHGTSGRKYRGETHDELSGLKKHVKAIESCETGSSDAKYKHVKTLLCVGNHDTWTAPPLPVPAWIWWKNICSLPLDLGNGVVYKRDHRGLTIMVLGIYPNAIVLPLLSMWLKYAKNPVLIVFHYNLEGPYSNFWSDGEKKDFLKTIKQWSAKIAAIVVGHHHTTGESKWEGFKVIMGAGETLPICEFDPRAEKANESIKVVDYI
jgi:DNA repair exonuclease SbcCD nuclease subunit